MYNKIIVYGLCVLLVLSGLIVIGSPDMSEDVIEGTEQSVTTERSIPSDPRSDDRQMMRERTSRNKFDNLWLERNEMTYSPRLAPNMGYLSSIDGMKTMDAPPSLDDYTPSDPIFILGDDDFAEQAAAEGWPGSGTEMDPWIIEGYDIDATDHENAIYIGNVDEHFIIRDCLLYDAMIYEAFNPPHQWPSGIQLNNTNNGLIEGNEIFASGAGIFVKGAGDNTFVNNTVYGNGVGVMLFETENNDIIYNTYWGNYYGAIGIWDCTHSYVAENDMTDNGILIFGDILEQWNTHTIDTTNTVNGNPVFYLKDEIGDTIPMSAGQVILANCTDITVSWQEDAWAIQLGFSNQSVIENNQLSPAFIDLQFSSDNLIQDNQISHETWDALVIAFGSNDNTVVNNTFFESEVGIYIEFSSNGNVIAYNNVSGNYDEGIMVVDSMYNHIYENEIHANIWGIAIAYSDNNVVEKNNLFNNEEIGIEVYHNDIGNMIRNNTIGFSEIGVHHWDAVGNTVEHNIIFDTLWTCINLGMSDDNRIQHNRLSDSNDSAFHIWDSHHNLILNNNISNNDGWTALGLYDSTENVILGNTASNNDNAIHLSNSSYNAIEHNDISNGGDGVNLWESYENHILNNTITWMWTGIYVHHSHDNLISGNEIKDNAHGTQVWDSHWNKITDNTISYNDHQGINLSNSDLNTILNNTLSYNNDAGIEVISSNENSIRNNLISNNSAGVYISDSMFNQIEDNEIIGSNMNGVRLSNSSENLLYNNNIHDNWAGIDLDHSNINFMIYNHIWNHGQNGVQSFSSNDNEFYHNIFEANSNHVWDEGNNIWDNGYPSGGNYWDTHTYPDEYGGSDQDEDGPDGIVDDQFDVPGGDNNDNYPLAEVPVRLQFSMDLFSYAESEGWQFVSLPVIPDNVYIGSVLGSIEGSYESLMYYDTHADQWNSHVPDRAEHYNNLHSWDHNIGMWIRMNEDAELSIWGRLPTVTSNALLPGWNMISIPSENAGNHCLPGEVTKIGYFNTAAEYNIVYDLDPINFEFEPGQGYWVYNSANEYVIWTIEY